jgi:RNA polymerase sigma factor (TIGR02999 family)
VTVLLRQAADGNRDSYERLFSATYEELRRVAARQVRYDAEVSAAELVSELFVKFGGTDAASLRGAASRGRSHFFAIAARAMRQILVDLARREQADKRGGGWVVTTLQGKPDASRLSPDELIALDDALASLDERARAVVEARFFGGMTDAEIAEAMDISLRTVAREWARARAKLYVVLYGGKEPG